MKEARRKLAQAMRARPSATYLLPYHAVRLRLQLAKVYLALAEQAMVRQLLREIDDVVSRRPSARRRVDRERAGRLIIQYPYQGDAEAAFAYSRLRQ